MSYSATEHDATSVADRIHHQYRAPHHLPAKSEATKAKKTKRFEVEIVQSSLSSVLYDPVCHTQLPTNIQFINCLHLPDSLQDAELNVAGINIIHADAMDGIKIPDLRNGGKDQKDTTKSFQNLSQFSWSCGRQIPSMSLSLAMSQPPGCMRVSSGDKNCISLLLDTQELLCIPSRITTAVKLGSQRSKENSTNCSQLQ